MQPELDLAVQRFIDRLAMEMADRIERHVARLVGERATNEPQALDVKTAAVRLGVSATTMHELVVSGQVASVKVGRRRLIAASTIDGLLAGDSPVREVPHPLPRNQRMAR